jgi:glycine cleavage system T protein (aminomethyltransferase)
MQAVTGPPKKTPLHGLFRSMGARLVDFAGWEMPVQFGSVLEEHQAVRTAAGLFDVSHMGEIEVRGPAALGTVQGVTCNDAGRLQEGQVQYSALTTESGTFVDDILVYRRAADRFLLVVNAGNTDKDFAWIVRHAEGEVEVQDLSSRHALLALQGPRAAAILQPLVTRPLEPLRHYHFLEADVRGIPCLLSRTGYTGEDGFEIDVAPEAAEDLFRALLQAGRSAGLLPCGLGARDTLRLEARMLLYGNDIDESTTVVEAGLPGIVRGDKGPFIGREALRREMEGGPRRRLVGFEMVQPGVARHGYPVRGGGGDIGRVTSGSFAPSLKKNIGLAYVPAAQAALGTECAVVIRGRDVAARIVATPFYRRAR